MLQPSSIIASSLAEASAEDRHYPAEIGEEPQLPERATNAVKSICAAPGVPVRSEAEGFLAAVHGGRIVDLAAAADGPPGPPLPDSPARGRGSRGPLTGDQRPDHRGERDGGDEGAPGPRGVLARLLELLAGLHRAAEREGVSTTEIERQRAAILETAATKLEPADLEAVARSA